MIDTIFLIISFRSRPQVRDWTLFGRASVARNSFILEKYVYNQEPVDGFATPQITISHYKNFIWYITISVSLPKMLFGTNVKSITEEDVIQGLFLITRFLNEKPGVVFDAASANVCRVDYSWNFNVGETRLC